MILRQIRWLSLLAALAILTLNTYPVQADADFESVRIKEGYEDMSGRGGDPKAKYWRESYISTLRIALLTVLMSIDESM